jgi:hypothetical protein
MTSGLAVSLIQMPATHGPHFDIPPSGAGDLRLSLDHCFTLFWQRAFNTSSESVLLVDVIYMSQRRDPRQYLHGEPRVQFHLNRRFLRRKILSGTTGEEPFPDWNVAHCVKKSGVGDERILVSGMG